MIRYSQPGEDRIDFLSQLVVLNEGLSGKELKIGTGEQEPKASLVALARV